MHRRTRRFLIACAAALAVLAFPLVGCGGCEDTTAGAGGDGTGGAGDGTANGGGDGTGGNGGDGTGVDGTGNGLDDSLEAFCAGTGSVGSVGGSSLCAGDIAEETFQFALCACQDITVGSNVFVDSFDSQVGSYGGSNRGTDGNVGLNEGPMDMKQATIHGSCYVGGGGVEFGPSSSIKNNLYAYGDATERSNTNVTIERNAFVNGSVASSYTVNGDLYAPNATNAPANVGGSRTDMDIPEQLPCPCAPDQLLRVDELVSWAKDHNDNGEAIPGGSLDPGSWTNGGPADTSLPCGRYFVDGINQENGNFSLNAEGRLVLFVDGDFHTGSLNITTAPGAEIDLFVSGDLIIEAAADFGSTDNPSSVRTYVWGQVVLQASAEFAGNIYAPNADLDFGASANLYGSVFARNVIFSAATTKAAGMADPIRGPVPMAERWVAATPRALTAARAAAMAAPILGLVPTVAR
jgi:hypothetical protein